VRRWDIGLAAVLAAAHVGAPAAEVAPRPVAAPHHGDVLFHFYQDHTFTALTSLMVSQHFQRLAQHDDDAEVLRGGLLLSYGLHDEASAVFARLIERNAPPAVQDRAWYFLAKVRHQRGLLAQADEALARIAAPLAAPLEDERRLLQAQLSMARQDWTAAAALLETLQDSPTAGPYARYNLGVALIRHGDTARGSTVLEAVGRAPAPDEELRSLRDRANVALGFAALAGKQPREARTALQRVRLQGPSSNKALLGFGWAAAELNEPRLALVPWTELAGRGGLGQGDAAVLEARIAVPYAYSELGATARALQGYEEAAAAFEAEQRALADSIAAIRAGKLTADLLAGPPAGGMAAFDGLDLLPEMPHAAHLAPLFADHEFQEAYKNLRDLQFLQGNLQQWLDSLGAYNDMLDARRRAFERKLPAARAGAGNTGIAALQARRDALAAELAAVQAQADAAALATPGERGLLERVQRSQDLLERAAGTPLTTELAEAAERLRRAAGALTWQLTQEFSARGWEATKALRGTDLALGQARERDAALARAQQDEPARHAAHAQRIATLAQRIQALRPEVAVASRAVQRQMQDIAVAELQSQQQRLQDYAAQARLAIAQIHDRAQFARRADAGAPP